MGEKERCPSETRQEVSDPERPQNTASRLLARENSGPSEFPEKPKGSGHLSGSLRKMKGTPVHIGVFWIYEIGTLLARTTIG